jgi:hypothetical protein
MQARLATTIEAAYYPDPDKQLARHGAAAV